MKFTIKQFNEKFPTSDACLDYLWRIHFADKPCERCGLLEGFHKLPKRPAYQCECGNQIYPLAGTPFHKSTTDLRTWFLAIFFMTNTRSGMSALQFQRISGVTYKTAWRIFKQVRLMMADDDTLLDADVEVDEAYMHPNPQKRSTAKPHNSQVMFGMVERGGRARIKHVKSSGVRVLIPEIQKNIGKTATIFTDEHGSYRLLKRIRKKLAQVVDEDEAPRFCYTTLQAFKASTPEDDEVWQVVGKPLEVFGLKDI